MEFNRMFYGKILFYVFLKMNLVCYFMRQLDLWDHEISLVHQVTQSHSREHIRVWSYRTKKILNLCKEKCNILIFAQSQIVCAGHCSSVLMSIYFKANTETLIHAFITCSWLLKCSSFWSSSKIIYNYDSITPELSFTCADEDQTESKHYTYFKVSALDQF